MEFIKKITIYNNSSYQKASHKRFLITLALRQGSAFSTLTQSQGLLPQGEAAGGEGSPDINHALVAAAAKTKGNVAMGLPEGTVNEDIDLSDDIKQCGIMFYFLPCIAGVTPDVVAQFLLDAVDEGTGAVGLLQRVAAAQRDRSLVIGDDLHQFIKGPFFPTLEIPGSRIVTARAMMAAARHVD